MLRAMDSAVSGLRAHQNKLDVIGNNIANVNTFGFKSQNYSFKEAMYQTSTTSTKGSSSAGGVNAAQYGYGSMMGSISTDMSASTPTYVGGLNACIDGEGFFVTYGTAEDGGFTATDVKQKGEISYSRVGQFSIDGNGYLVDANGNFIYGFRPTDAFDATQGVDTNTIYALKVPSDGGQYGASDTALQLTDVKINSLGEVTGTVKDGTTHKGETISLGKIAIATFQNPEGLTKSGSFYYSASTTDNSGSCSVTPSGDGTASLMTGYIEASNVDLAKEFSDMITTQRGFQANSKIITVSDEILSDLISMKR